MGKINVTKTLEVETSALWGLVRDFGNVPWIPGGENAEIQGAGPGMVRIFQGPGGAVHEVLESIDEGAQALVYTIPKGIPFPVTGYRSTMAVSDDDGHGRLSWTCEFEPDGVTEEEAGKTLETMYGVMMGWISDQIAKG